VVPRVEEEEDEKEEDEEEEEGACGSMSPILWEDPASEGDRTSGDASLGGPFYGGIDRIPSWLHMGRDGGGDPTHQNRLRGSRS
jgi:hypothetical protein